MKMWTTIIQSFSNKTKDKTLIMNMPRIGCLVRVSKEEDGKIAEALQFIPNVSYIDGEFKREFD